MIIALFEGKRALVEARRASPPGAKRLWKEFSEEFWIMEIVVERIKSGYSYNLNRKIGMFSGNDNSFMLVKLSCNNLLAHEYFSETEYLKLINDLRQYSQYLVTANENLSTMNKQIEELSKNLV